MIVIIATESLWSQHLYADVQIKLIYFPAAIWNIFASV